MYQISKLTSGEPQFGAVKRPRSRARAGFPAHAALMDVNITVLEGMNLRSVRPGFCRLICFPLKFRSEEAARDRSAYVKE